MIVKNLMFLLVMLLAVVISKTAQADSTVLKAYKAAFPDAHPKCMDCHLPSVPWEHPWNDYGKAVKKAINAIGIGDVPSGKDIGKISDVFKQIGKVEDFKGATVKQ